MNRGKQKKEGTKFSWGEEKEGGETIFDSNLVVEGGSWRKLWASNVYGPVYF